MSYIPTRDEGDRQTLGFARARGEETSGAAMPAPIWLMAITGTAAPAAGLGTERSRVTVRAPVAASYIRLHRRRRGQ